MPKRKNEGLSLLEIRDKYLPPTNKTPPSYTKLLAKFLYCELEDYCKRNNINPKKIRSERNYDGLSSKQLLNLSISDATVILNHNKLVSLIKLLYNEDLGEFTKRENIKYSLIKSSAIGGFFIATGISGDDSKKLPPKPERKNNKKIESEKLDSKPVESFKLSANLTLEKNQCEINQTIELHNGGILLNIETQKINDHTYFYFINAKLKINDNLSETIRMAETSNINQAMDKFNEVKELLETKGLPSRKERIYQNYKGILNKWRLNQVTNDSLLIR